MDKTRHWLGARKTGIGGSDAAALLGVSKWKTPLDVYLSKITDDVQEETPAMHWGHCLEPIVRDEYITQTGASVLVEPTTIYRHPEYPWMIGSLDGMATLPNQERRILEVKTSRSDDGWGNPGTDEIPVAYIAQVQHYMAITGAPCADVAVLIGGSDFRLYHVPADADIQHLLIETEQHFWHEHVVPHNPPPPTTAKDLTVLFPRSFDVEKEATDEIHLVVKRLVALKAQRDALDKDIEEAEYAVKTYMGDAAGLTYQGKTLATWKSSKDRQKFDAKAFALADPITYQRFCHSVSGVRRFLIKE